MPKTSEQRTEIEHTITSNILFQTMDDDARQTIVDAMSEKLFHPGDVIIKQGDMGDFYYVISEGLCDVFKNGNKVVEVHKGSGFGELALLYDAPRAATVVAQTEVRTWALDRTTFKQVVVGTTMKKRELYQEFLKGVAILSTLSDNELMNLADALVPVSGRRGGGERERERGEGALLLLPSAIAITLRVCAFPHPPPPCPSLICR